METTDLLIIGGGPGGLGAGTAFSRTLRPWLLYDSGAYRNGSSRSSHTIMGYDGADPAAWRADARRDLEKYSNGEIRDAQITFLARVESPGQPSSSQKQSLFEARDSAGNVIRARKVVLASGARDVLPDIPGLAGHWGSRALHCLFCHGTETAGGAMGFLLPASDAGRAAVLAAMLTMWAAVPHTRTVVLTHGAREEDVEGLVRYADVIKSRGIEVVSAPIARVETTPEGDMRFVLVGDGSESELVLPYVMVAPTVEANAHARPLLTPALLGVSDLGPGGALPPPAADSSPPAFLPARAGADPRTAVRGLFWAGNAGSTAANVSMSVAQGQNAGIVAAGEVAGEDLEAGV